MSHSAPYLLSQAVVTVLAAEFAGQDVTIRDNPTSPDSIKSGDRVVLVEDWEDAPGNQPNQTERRTFTLDIGVINRTETARAAADADMQRVKAAIVRDLPAACRTLRAEGHIDGFQAAREGRRLYRIENVDVGGALIITRFSIDYTTSNSTARGR